MYIGEIFLEFVNMLPAFQTYCLQQSTSVNLLNTLEKEKELLRYAQGERDPSSPLVHVMEKKLIWELFLQFLSQLFCVILNGKDRGYY